MISEIKLDQVYHAIKTNRWHRYFYIFCRISLAIGFVAAGIVKIQDERFASGLSVIHPMGTYLEALHHTGYYYTFIGIAQVVAALLLLFKRTALLGAIVYFPIILNIWILSLAVRFDGSFVSSTWMVFANLYILCYNYDRLKFIFKKDPPALRNNLEASKNTNWKFPFAFFGSAFILCLIPIIVFQFGYDVKPRNSLALCKSQFENTEKEAAGFSFCECVHTLGNPLDSCLDQYDIEISNLKTAHK